MKTVVPCALALVLAGGCAKSMSLPEGTRSGPTPDTSLGLSKGSLFEVPEPPSFTENASAPGDEPLLPRSYVLAPPRVPHAVADFLPITRTDNACLDCHDTRERKAGEPTPIPSSHYMDLRHGPGEAGPKVVGARYVCLSCHAATSDAAPLVENRFRR